MDLTTLRDELVEFRLDIRSIRDSESRGELWASLSGEQRTSITNGVNSVLDNMAASGLQGDFQSC